jgi:signal transduction histidine kinase
VLDAVGARDDGEGLRRLVPLGALVTAIGAVLSEPGTRAENLVAFAAVVPFFVWARYWRSMPTLLLIGSTAAALFFCLSSGHLEALIFLLCVAGAAVGGWESSQRAVVVAVAIGVSTPVAIEKLFPDGVLFGVWIMGFLLSLLLPRGFRRQIQLVTELATAREEIARQVALDEKRAIARDVHDLVGHGLAAVLLHVTGARHLLRRDPDAADEALADAEAVGRRSLQELRRTLGVLRATDGEDAAAPPLPSAGDLATAVDRARGAGLDVTLRIDGDVTGVDPVVGLSVHRVAEEALANALRHAPRAVTDVVLLVDGENDAVTLTVESVGPLQAPDPADAERPRFGLIGMRERTAAVGGELEVGPTATGWAVRCRVPLAAVPSEQPL